MGEIINLRRKFKRFVKISYMNLNSSIFQNPNSNFKYFFFLPSQPKKRMRLANSYTRRDKKYGYIWKKRKPRREEKKNEYTLSSKQFLGN